ncbi:TetR/AcrR family transcriptional regulator [Paenibacillus apiarius]|uniref:TetR/AcrR family transcriptional regulator n=1 Tax=Paenibacillus apiarius TaxID=46240 RepID=UPI00197FB0E5|nr:TetR/AcrR family transcriptional regulator [Paenibacillus apiarius]MBN3526922.1 TetR family transcriptional regulator [Paenibacillus apiarius]
MTEKALTKDVILDAAERELIKYGWNRTTLISIAKSLNVSHAALYSYFRSKVALRDAILERWLLKYSDTLDAITKKDGNAAALLHEWFFRLFQLKKKELIENEQLFALNTSLIQENTTVIQKHEERLINQLDIIIQRGINNHEINDQDSSLVANAVFGLMAYFYHPAFSKQWREENIDDEFRKSWEIVSRGLFHRSTM